MRLKIFTLFLLGVAFNASIFATNVTFKVDMNDVADAFTTPEVNGTFNGWCGGCAPMSDADADGIWELVIDLTPGNYEFKYAADTWNIQENLTPGTPCTVSAGGFTNRVLTVAATPIELDPVCWGACLACGIAPEIHDVTFRVDMNNVADPFTTPEVNGTFNEWCGGCAPMSDEDMDGIWELTIPLEAGNYEFKFAADAWNIQENLTPGSICTVTEGPFTNRVLSVSDQDLELEPVCWGSCLACNVAPTFYDVTFRVDMTDVTDAFTTPEVNGTFNEFCGGCAPMTNVGNGVWELVIALEPGNYEFKYAADTWNIQEDLDAADACTITDGTFVNRSLTVVNQDIDLGTVCWASCEPCGGIVNNCELEEILSFDDANSLDGWAPAANATNEQEASYEWAADAGVTTGALLITGTNQADAIGAAYIFEYLDDNFDYQGATEIELSFDVKLAAPLEGAAFHLLTEFPGVGVTNTFDLQTQGLNETDWTNFSYTFDGLAPGNLFRISFNIAAGAFVGAGGEVLIDNITISCLTGSGIPGCTDPTATNYDPNAEDDDGSCTYMVIFRVDMAEVTDAYTTPEVNGTFNGFCGGCAPMTNIGGTVWELVIPLASGSYEFKYAADTWNIQENLTQGDACTSTIDGFTNRSITVNGAGLDLGTVCWGSCLECGTVVELYDVTFRVDMNNVTEAFTTPEVNGTFNDFCGGCAPMSDVDADGVWELVISLAPGTYEFKYAADTWTIQEMLTEGDPCTSTIDGFTNRTLTVVDANIDLAAVCWASCDACEPDAVVEQTNLIDKVYPNPVTGSVLNINLNTTSSELLMVEIYDAQGRLVLSESHQNKVNIEVNTSKLVNGSYSLVLRNNQNFSSQAIIINR